ncbi:MAG: aminotransferase class I/II-fold pyridoxal phosphate-dependent enzyme, partial [Anaerolinea sp.]|nr:aminotransferase class I/II-fold pyridoxal phosphate-dependent enzyme [Anaerolinea sp.]
LAEFVIEHDLILCADEIHSDLILADGAEHISIAALGPAIAARTITLLAPSKTYNIPGLGLGFAVSASTELIRSFQHAVETAGLHCGPLAFTAALAAYAGGDEWLRNLLAYLRANRDHVADFMHQYLPHIPITLPEATYLSWFDLRGLGLDEPPAKWLLEHARVGLNDGAFFGESGRGFVRLNFACPRATLTEALGRIRAALAD